ncbi:MAG: rRNA maturation RNase YbeY [Mycoplasmataceae bacterium]|jgi:probable rRNA maturation factor|nr:rRNA maturation RNase YbeY [Mycoplasmataceae bacterium]
MKYHINYDSSTETSFKHTLEPLFRKIVKLLGKTFNMNEKTFFETTFVDEKKINELNKKYRGIDKPTDVLSFGLNNEYLLGEIYICSKIAIENSKEEKVSAEYEICLLFVHGFLHLIGMDHATLREKNTMFSTQDYILEKAEIKP